MPAETPLTAYNFRVTSPFGEFRVSKVRNIERSVEVEILREGGRNHAVLALAKPPSQEKRLILERGVCTVQDALNLDQLLGIPQTRPESQLTIAVYDPANQSIQKLYRISDWMLVRWSLGDLDASANTVLLESAEIVYGYLK